jgi:hypothetical protein
MAKHKIVAIPKLEKTYENVEGMANLTLARIVALNLSSIHLSRSLNRSMRLSTFCI